MWLEDSLYGKWEKLSQLRGAEEEAELSSLAGCHAQRSPRPREAFASSCLSSNFVNPALGTGSRGKWLVVTSQYISVIFGNSFRVINTVLGVVVCSPSKFTVVWR